MTDRLKTLSVPLVRLSAIIGQIVYVKIYSHHLSNYQLGIYFYLMTSSYFLNALIFVPMDYYQQSRVYPFREAGISLTVFLRFNKSLLLVIGVITVLVMLPCLFVGRVVAMEAVVCAALSVTLYVTTAFKNLLNNLDHKLMVALIFLVEVVLKTGLFYAAMRVFPPQAIYLLGSNILALLIVLGLLILAARRRRIFSDGSAHRVDYREAIQFSYPLAIAAIANWLQSQGYRLLLVPLGYTEMVGLYGVVSNVGVTAMSAVSVIFGQMYSPRLYQTQGGYLRTYLRHALLLVGFILLIGYACSGFVVPLLTGHNRAPYSHLFVYGVGTEAGNFLAGALAIYMTIKNRTKVIMNSAFVGVLTVAVAVSIVYFAGRTSVFTIGLPIVFSQAAVVIYMLYAWQKPTSA